MDIKVGMCVKLKHPHHLNSELEYGVVRGIGISSITKSKTISVSFKGFEGGHNGLEADYHTRDKSCWNYSEDTFDKEFIIIDWETSLKEILDL